MGDLLCTPSSEEDNYLSSSKKEIPRKKEVFRKRVMEPNPQEEKPMPIKQNNPSKQAPIKQHVSSSGPSKQGLPGYFGTTGLYFRVKYNGKGDFKYCLTLYTPEELKAFYDTLPDDEKKKADSYHLKAYYLWKESLRNKGANVQFCLGFSIKDNGTVARYSAVNLITTGERGLEPKLYNQLVIILKQLGLTEVQHIDNQIKYLDNIVDDHSNTKVKDHVLDEWDRSIGRTKITNLEPPSIVVPSHLFMEDQEDKSTIHSSGLTFLRPPIENYGHRISRKCPKQKRHDILLYGATCLYLQDTVGPIIAVFTPNEWRKKIDEKKDGLRRIPKSPSFQSCIQIWKLDFPDREIHFHLGFSITEKGQLKPDMWLPENKYSKSKEDYYQEIYIMLQHFYGIPVIPMLPVKEENELLNKKNSAKKKINVMSWPAKNKDGTPCLFCWKNKEGRGNLCTKHKKEAGEKFETVFDDSGKWPAPIGSENGKSEPCRDCFKMGYNIFCPLHETL